MTSRAATKLLADEVFIALGRRIIAGQCALFLGAGASLDSGGPTTAELADLIAEKVLRTDQRDLALDQVVEYAEGSVGRQPVADLIVQRLDGLDPSPALQTLAAFPWRSVYSVNFDDLFEKALDQAQPGRAHAIFSASRLDEILPDRLPVYLLHGSIQSPMDRNMGLILTQGDIARAATQRQAFYRRLTDDLRRSEALYVGFSLADSDFRRVITELHDSVDNQLQLIPRGYAVIPSPPPFAQPFWDTKKISFIAASLSEVAEALAEIKAGTAGVLPIAIGANPLLPPYLRAINPGDELAYEITSSFEFPDLDDGLADARLFLRGGPATWATIRDRFDAARDLTDDVVEALIVSPADEPIRPTRSATRVVLLTGAAGVGKTTIAKRVAWELCHSWGRKVVWARHPSRVQLDVAERVALEAGERLYVFVDDAADSSFQVANTIDRSKRRHLPITWVIVERENEWVASTDQHPVDADRSFVLGTISDGEALGIIDRLTRADELGTLSGLPTEVQVRRLTERAGRHLVVAMREATEDGRFDQIIVDEYERLPSDDARRAYVTVCTLYQLGVPVRAGLLSRTTGVPLDQFGAAILVPARFVILEVQEAAWREPLYAARHRVIADVIFRRAFPSSTQRATQIQHMLRQLDPGYRDDGRAFNRLLNARWLREHGVEPEDQEQIYVLARRLRPDDPFVIQQQALSWRFQNRPRADQLLNEAARMAPDNDAIRHSQATLLLDDAKNATGFAREELLAKAEQEFRMILRHEPANSAPYVSLADICLRRAADADDPAARLGLVAAARRVLGDGFNRGAISSYLLDMAGRVDEAAGDLEGAEEDYARAARVGGPDPHMWVSYARFLLTHRGAEAAARALNEALDLNPLDPQVNHEYARVLEEVIPIDVPAIRRAYDLAIAEPVRGHLPELDFAIFLYRQGMYEQAEEQFQVLRTAQLPNRIKTQPRGWLTQDGGRRVFLARVDEVRLTRSYLRIAELPDRIFIHTRDLDSDRRRVGSDLRVNVLFNCLGPRAVPTPGVN